MTPTGRRSQGMRLPWQGGWWPSHVTNSLFMHGAGLIVCMPVGCIDQGQAWLLTTKRRHILALLGSHDGHIIPGICAYVRCVHFRHVGPAEATIWLRLAS
ncbi:hypothetical protein GQ53DRAFT_92420 [Thozetella sp. PMI_491]|nr:hypothetical protein GQ53DRAFT_92420 [Thozetella sp. PMI_491]